MAAKVENTIGTLVDSICDLLEKRRSDFLRHDFEKLVDSINVHHPTCIISSECTYCELIDILVQLRRRVNKRRNWNFIHGPKCKMAFSADSYYYRIIDDIKKKIFPMDDVTDRAKTFNKNIWPDYAIKNLSECGFYYLGIEDRTKCAFCHIVLSDWKIIDDPWHEHKKCSPHCKVVKDYYGKDVYKPAI